MLNALIETADLLSMHASSKRALGSPDFADNRYAAKPFSASNFKEIALPKENSSGKISSLRSQLFQPDVEKLSVNRRNDFEQSSKIAFVDAGNLELLGSSNFSVHLIRGYFSIFQRNCRIVPRAPSQKYELFSVAVARESSKGIAYECSIIPISAASGRFFPAKKLVFDSFDETLSARQNFRANISVIGAAIRRYMEWSIASEVIENELDSGDILLRDGTLESSVTGEDVYSKKAFDAAHAKGAALCALAKTSSLLTTTGFPLAYAVDSIAETEKVPAPWLYYPLCENKNPGHPAEIFVVKLHKNSARAFRFEMDKHSAQIEGNVISAISEISANSCDASFIGYPYGLIDADAMSRISFREAQNYRAMLSSVLEKKGALASIQKLSGAIDAHDVLNEIII